MLNSFPTSKENIAINLIFEWMGESRINRGYDEYMAIAARFPKLDACVAFVNQRLEERTQSGFAASRGICYFKAGDSNFNVEPYPASLSRETIRRALNKMGRDQAIRQRRSS